jgi:hypothetical protein
VDGAYPSPDVGLPVTGFGAPAAREDRRAARGRDVCSRCLAVSWIQQLKSLASTRDARSHSMPTASRNRHHRSRPAEYDLSVAADFPDASRSRRKTDTGSTIPPPGPTMRYGSWASPVATTRPARDTTSRDRSRLFSSPDSITPPT